MDFSFFLPSSISIFEAVICFALLLHFGLRDAVRKKRDYVGKIPNKIAEVIWEDCGGYMISIWQLTASLNSSVFTILLD